MRLHLAGVLLSLASVAGAQAPPRTAGMAAVEAQAAAETKDWPTAERAWREAARLAEERAQANPQDLDAAQARDVFEYDAACAAALQGRADAAFDLLRGLLERGWLDNDDMLATDPDLASLRADRGRFQPLLDRGRGLLASAAAGHVEGKILLPKRARSGSARAGIVALHGGGGSVEDWEHAWQPVADSTGAVVILVRGSVVQGPGAFSYDQRRPARDAARIEAWIAKARAMAPGLSDDELFLVGFSQGGGMAWVLGTEGERSWRGILPIGGYVQVAVRDAVSREPVHALAAYAFVGETDEAAIREINAQLVARKGLVRFRGHVETMPGGHGLPADFPAALARAMRWCRKADAEMKSRERLSAPRSPAAARRPR